MGRLNFGRLFAPYITQHLHDDAVDGLAVEGVHHGLQAEPKLDDPLRCRWSVPLSWVHNHSIVMAF